MLIDTHAHLYAEEFDADRDAMMARAREAGVGIVLLPNIDEGSTDAMHRLAEAYPGMAYPMMGLHPCSVKPDFEDVLARMEKLLESGGYIGVGETGLDYYWDTTYIKEQQTSLELHIEWAIRFNLPIVLHTRDSFQDTFDIIRKHKTPKLRGVFHCFSGTLADAEAVLSLDGFYMGIGGVATFKNGGLDKVLPRVPLSRLMLETDSPYLAPVPYRGKRNESAYTALVAQRVAELMRTEVEEVATATTANANALFGL